MNDTQFDHFFNDKFRDHAVPVPAHLWEKVVEGQFDQFVGSKLKDASSPLPDADATWGKINDKLFDHFVADSFEESEAPVPAGLWDKITDGQFDGFVADRFENTEAPVPAGIWDKIADGQFDDFVSGKLQDVTTAVPAGLWDKISDGQFDNFVADKLKGAEAPVPAGLWEKIMPEEEDDDKVIFWWFRYPAAAILILGLLTAGAIGGYFYFNRTSFHETLQSGAPSSANDHTVVTPLQPGTGNHQNAADGQSANTEANTGNNSISSAPADANTKASTVAPDATTGNGFNTSASVTPPQKNLPPVIGKQSDELNSGVLNGASVTGIRRKKGLDNLRPQSDLDKTLAQNPLGVFGKQEDATIVTAEDLSVENYPQRLRLNGFTVPSALNGYGTIQSLEDKKLSTLNHTAQFRNIIICPADNKNRNTDWFLEAYASPDVPFKSFSNVSATPLFLLKKDSAESMQMGYTAGLRLVKPITDNIILKGGVQYSQINQKYTYRTENEVKTTTVVTVRTIIRAPGDTVVVQDTSVVQTAGYRTNTVYNHFRTIDIPLTVGYQFGNDDIKIGINAGVVFNISSWYQGVLLDSSLAPVTLNKNGNGVYRTNIGMGLVGSISVIKKLGEDMAVFAEPYFRYNLSNMTTGQSKYQQKFSLGGLSIGLRLNLNRK